MFCEYLPVWLDVHLFVLLLQTGGKAWSSCCPLRWWKRRIQFGTAAVRWGGLQGEVLYPDYMLNLQVNTVQHEDCRSHLKDPINFWCRSRQRNRARNFFLTFFNIAQFFGFSLISKGLMDHDGKHVLFDFGLGCMELKIGPWWKYAMCVLRDILIK